MEKKPWPLAQRILLWAFIVVPAHLWFFMNIGGRIATERIVLNILLFVWVQSLAVWILFLGSRKVLKISSIGSAMWLFMILGIESTLCRGEDCMVLLFGLIFGMGMLLIHAFVSTLCTELFNGRGWWAIVDGLKGMGIMLVILFLAGLFSNNFFGAVPSFNPG